MTIKTYSAVSSDISTLLADNTSRDISEADVRQVSNDLLDLNTVYGGLYVADGASAQAMTTTPAKLTAWAGNGASNGTTPDHTSDIITIDTNSDGVYSVNFNVAATGNAGTIYVFMLYKNASAVTGYQCRLTGAANAATASLCALVTSVVATDTFSIYCKTVSGSQNVTVIDAQLVIRRTK